MGLKFDRIEREAELVDHVRDKFAPFVGDAREVRVEDTNDERLAIDAMEPSRLEPGVERLWVNPFGEEVQDQAPVIARERLDERGDDRIGLELSRCRGRTLFSSSTSTLRASRAIDAWGRVS